MSKSNKDFLTRQGLKVGEVLFYEGETGRQAFLVQSGTLQAVTKEGDKTIELGKINPGDIIGEMALIQDGPRTATVVAETEAHLIIISPQIMKKKLKSADPTLKAIMTRMTKIIQEENQRKKDIKKKMNAAKKTLHTYFQELHDAMSEKKRFDFSKRAMPLLDKLSEELDACIALSDIETK